MLPAKFEGALLGTMVGDALGAPVEGWDCRRLNEAMATVAGLPPRAPERSLYDAVLGLLFGGDVPPAPPATPTIRR